MNPQTELWLIRHAESTGNREGKLQGQEDLPLSPLGQRQARALANRLAKAHQRTPFAGLYSSDLIRARETADSVGMACGLRVTIDQRLREIDVGTWGGLSREDIARTYPDEWREWQTRSPTMRRGGGESYVDAERRIGPALHEIALNHSGARIIVIAHGGVLRAWLGALIGLPLTNIWHFSLGNTALTRVRPNEPAIGGSAPRAGRILCLNDCTHAEDVAWRSGEI